MEPEEPPEPPSLKSIFSPHGESIFGGWHSSVAGSPSSWDSISDMAKTPIVKTKVFIVHGHNGELKEGSARLVTKLGFDPIILDEEPNKGRTIIEKFEQHAQEAGFAIVLISADDVGGLGASAQSDLQSRARQNVIFELGYFIGKLGRGRVCAVYENGVELPSDLYGLGYVPYFRGGDWKYRIAKELKAAGYKVDLNAV